MTFVTINSTPKGLKGELLFIPQEKLNAVLAVLADNNLPSTGAPTSPSQTGKEQSNPLTDDPWQGLLGENE